jgi:quercetin dioxygenase-like cupin family protein
MTFPIRRVVTGHDARGKSIVAIDEIAKNIVSRRPGHSSSVIWVNDSTPANNASLEDESERDVTDCATNGAIFRVVEYAPGVAPRMHRTMTVDYAVVMSGEIDMGLDDGKVVRLKAGDVLVQRGTLHDWVNPGPEPCVIAFILIAATPVVAGVESLGALG